MKQREHCALSRVRAVTTMAAVAISVAACGGGGGGGGGGFPLLPVAPPPSTGSAPPPAPPPVDPPPPPAEAPTAAACTNEADFRDGTVLEAEFQRNLILEPALGAEKVYYKLEGRKPFAGFNPIAITSESDGVIVERVRFSDTEFTDLVDGNVVTYGRRITLRDSTGSRTDTLVFDPPLARPLNMKQGQDVTQKYRMKATSVFTPVGGPPGAPDPEQVYELTTVFAYGGTHPLQTAAGNYESCLLYEKTVSTTAGKPYDRNMKIEVPAEGPLRGQVVSRSLFSSAYPWQDFVVKVTYSSK